MGLQLERECAGANHVQVPGPVYRAEEVAHSEGGAASVPQHFPVGELVAVVLTDRTANRLYVPYIMCLFYK